MAKSIEHPKQNAECFAKRLVCGPSEVQVYSQTQKRSLLLRSVQMASISCSQTTETRHALRVEGEYSPLARIHRAESHILHADQKECRRLVAPFIQHVINRSYCRRDGPRLLLQDGGPLLDRPADRADTSTVSASQVCGSRRRGRRTHQLYLFSAFPWPLKRAVTFDTCA